MKANVSSSEQLVELIDRILDKSHHAEVKRNGDGYVVYDVSMEKHLIKK